MNESIRPGDEMTRQEIHAQLGGRLQGGISPTHGPNILLFAQHRPGMTPLGFSSDGALHFEGEGLEGDQQFTQGNKAVLHHKEDGRALRLFQDVGAPDHAAFLRRYRYIGEFELDSEEPYTFLDRPSRRGEPRRVIDFRLRPTGATAALSTSTAVTVERLTPLESAAAQLLHQSRLPYAPANLPEKRHTRREVGLISRLAAYLNSLGHAIAGHHRFPVQGGGFVVADLVDSTTNTIYEAKGSASRSAVREAIGQLMELRWRHGGDASIGIVLPSEPYEDLLDLCASLDIEVLWPDPDQEFRSSKS
ncbi:hypothetical protein ACFV4P_02585 [Kitasatospora sp. NPDC059795]|uniref:hypothetical protein n=1 Tax=Kitasatospora sp. NPDC059795 TaxID=3346949 RepID=UPI0036685960